MARCSAVGNGERGVTANQYRSAIEKVDLSQRSAARFLGIDERTSRRWAAGEAPIPEAVGKLLRLMVKLKLTWSDVA